MGVHRLILTDRGLGHAHRWAPSCSCGRWDSPGRRRKREAVELHRLHLTQVEHGSGQKARTRRGPGTLTPAEDLPDLLK